MANNQLITNDAIDKINYIVNKLEFVSNSVYAWNTDALEFNDTHRAGFTFVTNDIIKEIKEVAEVLRKR